MSTTIQTHTEQEYQALLQKIERFEERYQCKLDTLLDEKTPPKTIPFVVYQKLLQRFKLLRESPYKPTERLVIDEIQYQLEHPQKVDQDGFARINFETAARHINMSTSTPKRTIQAVIEQTPAYPLKCKWNVPEVTQDGRKIECLYAKATVPNLVAASMTLALEQKRKQGGNQYQCQNPTCLSTNVRKDSQIVCLDCGHISHLESTYPNGKLKNTTGKSIKSNLLLTDMPVHTATTTFSDEQPPAENFLSNDAQPVGMVITSDPPYDADRLAAIAARQDEAESSDGNEIEEAAALLLAVAGEDENHIEMSRTGPKKYYDVKPPRPLELSDLVDHLRAGQARGSHCSYRDGRTLSQCFDRDEAQTWEQLQAAAQKLAHTGYNPILDESPADRGGHLWIIYSDLVDATAARTAVLEIAPELADCSEYWPGPSSAKNWNRVRLPGAFYVRYGKHVEQPVKAWCKLANVATGEIAEDGRSAAKLLLSSLTPASIVPALPSISAEPASEIDTRDERVQACIVEEQNAAGRAAPLRNNDDQAPAIANTEVAPLPYKLPEVDARWVSEHGLVEETTLWFAITDAYSAAWYNKHHPLEEIQPLERNHMALSPNGEERTASTNYRDTPDGERWTDFSTHGRRSDGTHESGDALELAARVQRRPKKALLGENTREIVSWARAAVESAARAGQPVPECVEEPCIITPAGRHYHARLLAQARGKTCQQTATPASVHEQQVEQPPAACTIYVDEINTYDTPLPYKNWCHMAVDGDIEHLHTFARKLGLKAEWFQNKQNHPHYDLTPGKRAQALKLGAVPVSTLELIRRCYPVLHAIASSQDEQLQPAPAASTEEHDGYVIDQDGDYIF